LILTLRITLRAIKVVLSIDNAPIGLLPAVIHIHAGCFIRHFKSPIKENLGTLIKVFPVNVIAATRQ
jgi:hypothetical protein